MRELKVNFVEGFGSVVQGSKFKVQGSMVQRFENLKIRRLLTQAKDSKNCKSYFVNRKSLLAYTSVIYLVFVEIPQSNQQKFVFGLGKVGVIVEDFVGNVADILY